MTTGRINQVDSPQPRHESNYSQWSEQALPKSRCGWCCKSRWPQLHTRPSEAELPRTDVLSHLQTCHLKTDMLSALKLRPDLRRTSANHRCYHFGCRQLHSPDVHVRRHARSTPSRADQTPCDCNVTEQSNWDVWHRGPHGHPATPMTHLISDGLGPKTSCARARARAAMITPKTEKTISNKTVSLLSGVCAARTWY